jgi:hypothetical protein
LPNDQKKTPVSKTITIATAIPNLLNNHQYHGSLPNNNQNHRNLLNNHQNEGSSLSKNHQNHSIVSERTARAAAICKTTLEAPEQRYAVKTGLRLSRPQPGISLIKLSLAGKNLIIPSQGEYGK